MTANSLSAVDIAITIAYAIGIFVLAQYVTRRRPELQTSTEGYFFAGNQLPWWAIGASLIAANISAEQIIGMSGSGFRIGLAVASYEWMSAATLLLVGKFALPVFFSSGIRTMPGFLAQRFGPSVRYLMAVFWLAQYILINLTAILWLGGTAITTVTGMDPMLAVILLGCFSLAYQLSGGLKAVALTDIVQVSLLTLGGLIIVAVTLSRIGGHPSPAGVIRGASELIRQFPEHFKMILPKSSPYYKDLPGIAVLVGGMWIMNISYWGFNQYIIQRALAAKSLSEAQKGIAFAGYLKLLMPLIVVVPGMAALILAPDISRSDQAYPTMMTLLPTGCLGLVFAALVAAIVASSASKINSIATIFTMDIVKPLNPTIPDGRLVVIGRFASAAALLTAIIVAKPLLGSFDQVFQFGQSLTGFFAPAIVVIFVLGMGWRHCTTAGAFSAVAVGFAASCIFYLVSYLHQHPSPDTVSHWVVGHLPDMPFLNRVGWVFWISLVTCIGVSLLTDEPPSETTIDLGKIDFRTSKSFNAAALGIILILTALYAIFW
ncbi:sodium:solute symporter family transporter [Asticcacaulis sp. 201]|uniref:sodium:solute symporter family transporter n=1 Tax=Asticcacaulis sp. 201 TaxID=3028787 RepID=UPI002915F89F|nr:sodium/solute symporter [Asticcacaulis sp. 201]MDV6332052.1 sodium/solute symporter [Asticcacaulis sp. 201]